MIQVYNLTNAVVIITAQVITMPTGANIRPNSIVAFVCTSTIISQTLINIYIAVRQFIFIYLHTSQSSLKSDFLVVVNYKIVKIPNQK